MAKCNFLIAHSHFSPSFLKENEALPWNNNKIGEKTSTLSVMTRETLSGGKSNAYKAKETYTFCEKYK